MRSLKSWVSIPERVLEALKQPKEIQIFFKHDDIVSIPERVLEALKPPIAFKKFGINSMAFQSLKGF